MLRIFFLVSVSVVMNLDDGIDVRDGSFGLENTLDVFSMKQQS